MNGLAVAALAWLLLVVPGAMIAARFKHPPRANTPAAGTSPVPGHPPPGEGHGPPDVHAPAPADPHGGVVVSIDIFADDRIVTIYHTQDRAEVNTGRCHDCLAEAGARTDWDAELRNLRETP